MAKGGWEKRRIAQKKERERRERKRRERRKRLGQILVIITVLALIGTVTATALLGPDKGKLLNEGKNPGCTVPGVKAPNKPQLKKKPTVAIDAKKSYIATMVTSCGTVKVKLLAKDAPNTVENFVALARQGFYNGTIFHRVIPDFGGPSSDMVQGGDAVKGDGTGDPGYRFSDEHTVPFDTPGLLAMANSGPGTNGSQFFLMSGPVSHLNVKGTCPAKPGKQASCHSIFGQVIEGLDVIKKIAHVPGDAQNNKPTIDVVLINVTIEEK